MNEEEKELSKRRAGLTRIYIIKWLINAGFEYVGKGKWKMKDK